MKLIDYWRESLSSLSSSESTAVSTKITKIGFAGAGWPATGGKMYSIVVKSGMSSAGSCYSLIC